MNNKSWSYPRYFLLPGANLITPTEFVRRVNTEVVRPLLQLGFSLGEENDLWELHEWKLRNEGVTVQLSWAPSDGGFSLVVKPYAKLDETFQFFLDHTILKEDLYY